MDLSGVNLQIAELPAELQGDLRRFAQAYRDDVNREAIGGIVSDLVNPSRMGPPGPTEEIDAYTALAAFGMPGAQAIESIKAMRKRDEEQLWGETDVSTMSRLMTLVNATETPYAAIQAEADAAAQAGKLNRMDYISLMDRAVSRQRLAPDQLQVVENTVQTLGFQMRSWVMTTPNNPYLITNDVTGQMELSPQGDVAINRAVLEAQGAFWNDVYNKVPVDQAIENLKKRVGDSLNNFVGGNQGPQLVSQIKEKQQVLEAPTGASKRALVKFDQATGSLVTASGAPVGSDQIFFDNPKDLLDNAAVFAVDSGMDIKSPQATAFFTKQGEKMGAEGKAAAYEALIVAREGREAYKDVSRSLRFVTEAKKELDKGIERRVRQWTIAIRDGRQTLGFDGLGTEYTREEFQQYLKFLRDTRKALDELHVGVASREDTRKSDEIKKFLESGFKNPVKGTFKKPERDVADALLATK